MVEERLLVVGADVGGTSTRVGVATLDGTVVSLARGGSGNPNALGSGPAALAASAAEIRRVGEAALHDCPGTVAAMVIGMAGGGRAIAAGDAFSRAVTPDGVHLQPRVIGDLVVAFASGTPLSDGYGVIVGTGTAVGRVQEAKTTEIRDAWGWLLGDGGSGFWLGREAVRLTLRRLERREAVGELGQAVLSRADAITREELVQACYAAAPIWLAGFAPLLTAAAGTDADAARVVRRGAEMMLADVLDLSPEPPLPIVLAGSVVRPGSVVGAALTTLLGRHLDNPVLAAADGTIGALWLACRDLVAADSAVHLRLGNTFAERTGQESDLTTGA